MLRQSVILLELLEFVGEKQSDIMIGIMLAEVKWDEIDHGLL
jgi:hypothetical protein